MGLQRGHNWRGGGGEVRYGGVEGVGKLGPSRDIDSDRAK